MRFDTTVARSCIRRLGVRFGPQRLKFTARPMKSFRPIIIGTVAAVFIAASAAPAADKADDERKLYELPAIGVNLERPTGGWINVQTTGANMVVRFFDAEKKPVTTDVIRATARIRYAAKSGITRTVLNREGDMLMSPSNVRPPHNFFVTLTLLHGDDEAAATEVFNLKLP